MSKVILRPGDVIATRGGGLVGRVILLGTMGGTAHTGIVIGEDSPMGNLTHEAFSNKGASGKTGLNARYRNVTDEPIEVITVARNQDERDKIVAASQACLEDNAGYDWLEILRISLWFLGDWFNFFKLKPVGAGFLYLSELVWRASREDKYICSNHTMKAVLAARPELVNYTSYPPSKIHPEELVRALRALARDDWEASNNK